MFSSFLSLCSTDDNNIFLWFVKNAIIVYGTESPMHMPHRFRTVHTSDERFTVQNNDLIMWAMRDDAAEEKRAVQNKRRREERRAIHLFSDDAAGFFFREHKKNRFVWITDIWTHRMVDDNFDVSFICVSFHFFFFLVEFYSNRRYIFFYRFDIFLCWIK